MAIDGVGIIDSDCAHDVYNPIMEMYHLGQSIEIIIKNIDAFEPNFIYSELEHEIFITAYALAMWEIGGLTNEQLEKVNALYLKAQVSYGIISTKICKQTVKKFLINSSKK